MQRRSTKQSRGPNQSEKDFQAWLKIQPCCITGRNDVQVHHCVGSTGKHNKVLIGHYFCLPLSVDTHWLYHNRKREFKAQHGLQNRLWMELCNRYYTEEGKLIPVDVERAIMNCCQ